MKALKLAASLLAGLALAGSAPAASAAITYVLAGDATGAVLDLSYNPILSFDSQAAEFDFQGDYGLGAFLISGAHLTGGTVSAYGVSADIDFASGGAFGSVPIIGIAAFGTTDEVFGSTGSPPIIFDGFGLLGYDGRSSLAPTPVSIFGPDFGDGFGLIGIHFAGAPYILEIDHFENAWFAATGSVPGGIPEPATWGLMILGFGAAGAALRRRRAPALA